MPDPTLGEYLALSASIGRSCDAGISSLRSWLGGKALSGASPVGQMRELLQSLERNQHALQGMLRGVELGHIAIDASEGVVRKTAALAGFASVMERPLAGIAGAVGTLEPQALCAGRDPTLRRRVQRRRDVVRVLLCGPQAPHAVQRSARRSMSDGKDWKKVR